MDDRIAKLTDEQVKTEACSGKTITREVELPAAQASRFTLYQADAAADNPGEWRCIVIAGEVAKDIAAVEVFKEIDLDLLLGKLWLLATES